MHMKYLFFKKEHRSDESATSSQHKQPTTRAKKGFTLFVAVLVASFLLSIGFSIGNILLKQVIIAGSGGGSLVAFYAADSAVECATYWDRKDDDGHLWSQSPFGTSTAYDAGFGDPKGAGGPKCGPEAAVHGWEKSCNTGNGICDATATEATTTFSIDLKDPQNSTFVACASVLVSKVFDNVTGEEKTRIETRGYNSDLKSNLSGEFFCNLERQRVVERGLILNY
jgi:hypothetical protein